jgi:hypothetical protein
MLADRTFQAAQHRGLGLGQRQRRDRRPVTGQVDPGPAADLEHIPGQPGEQPLAERAQPGLLGLGHLAVVREREELGPQAHGFLVSVRLRDWQCERNEAAGAGT